MRFNCPSCGASYRIDLLKVPEEGARLNCSGCGARLLLRRGQEVVLAPPKSTLLSDADDDLGSELTASFTRLDLLPLEPASSGTKPLWHVLFEDGTQSTLDEEGLVKGISSGALDGETSVWRPGLEAWTSLANDRLAAEILRRSGPWQSGSITSIFDAVDLPSHIDSRAVMLPEQAPAALAQLAGRLTLPPSALPIDVAQEFDDTLGQQPEVVIAGEGMLRRGGAGSPVAVAVRRDQRRLLVMALGIPLLIILGWRVVSWSRGGQTQPVETQIEAGKEPRARGLVEQEEARRRRQRVLLSQGSFRLDSDQKAAVLERELDKLKTCGLNHQSDALVRFRIKPNGAPFDIRVAGITGEPGQCVRQSISRWRFPRFTGPADEMSFPLPND
jgi:predicted Zn finger-like uncharacterized protein